MHFLLLSLLAWGSQRFDNVYINENDFYRVYLESKTQFLGFSINLDNLNIKEDEYLAIQFIIKSGSYDNYYYDTSDPVTDNLIVGLKKTK